MEEPPKSHYKARFTKVLPNIVTVQPWSGDEFLETRYEDEESFFGSQKLFLSMFNLYAIYATLTVQDRADILNNPQSVPIKFSKRYDPMSIFSSHYNDGTLRWVDDVLLPDRDTIFVPKKYANKEDLASVIVIRPAIPTDVFYEPNFNSRLLGP